MNAPRGRKQEVSALTWRAWTAGWMMGLGIGIVALFLALPLPNNFYLRTKTPLVIVGVCSFLIGCYLLRQSKILSTIFASLWQRRES